MRFFNYGGTSTAGLFFPRMPQFFPPDNAALKQLYFMSLQCYTLKLFVTKHLL